MDMQRMWHMNVNMKPFDSNLIEHLNLLDEHDDCKADEEAEADVLQLNKTLEFELAWMKMMITKKTMHSNLIKHLNLISPGQAWWWQKR